MNGIIFPASPNWYCSKVSDCNDTGKLVFAAHNKLHVVDFSKGDLRFHGSSWEAHVERCPSLSLCQVEGFHNLCCSCGDDGFVKVWDIERRSVLHEYDGHEKDKLTSVHWSPIDSDLIIIGDEKGGIVSWRPKAEEIQSYIPEKGCVSALVCSPHDVWHVAIGYKSGTVFIFDLHRDGTILHRLRGHNEEILSIAWCPVLGQEAQNAGSAEMSPTSQDSGCLLATGSRDRTIRIWSTSTGDVTKTFTLPTNVGHRRERVDDGNRSRAWVTVSWPRQMPEFLLSSSHGGELLIWDIWKKSKKNWRVVDAQGQVRSHWRTIFNINVAKNYCFTISLDRQLCMWDLSDMRCIASRPTMGGFVYTMGNSPVNPGSVAIGVGDQIIRFWNLSQPGNMNKVNNLWHGIKSKVTVLCWHPSQENILAYGTDDGRVGVYDAFKNKPPLMANTFHKGTVYSIAFGPPCYSSEKPAVKTRHALYSCGDGIINEHNPARLDSRAVNINEIVMKTNEKKHCLNRSEIRWKPDMSVVAIGNDDGSVEILRAPDLKLLSVIHSTKKPVNSIQWHPEYTTQSGTEKSKLHSWIAIGSNELDVHIVDLGDVLTAEDNTQCTTVTESTCVLKGHSARVTCLSWSGHREGLLASASYDKSVQVWNVLTNEPIGNFRGHNGIIRTVLWHPLEEDEVFSGSDDFTLQCWKPSELKEKLPPPKGPDNERPKRKSKKKGKGAKSRVEQSTAAAKEMTSLDVESKNELLEILERKRLEITEMGTDDKTDADVNQLNKVDKAQNGAEMDNKCGEVDRALDATGREGVDSSELTGAELLAERKKKLAAILGMEEERSSKDYQEVLLPKRDLRMTQGRKRRLLFPLGNEIENTGKLPLVEDCVNIAYLKFGNPSAELKERVESGKLTHLGTFTDRQALQRMVTVESEYHLTHGHIESYFTLEVWKGNVEEMMRIAEEKNQLSDFVISMASFSKHPVYLSTCDAYAKQLEKVDHFMKAACYYLVCFKVYEAIDMLLSNKLFKEAIVLARLRLSRQDPKIQEAYVAWAQYLINEARLPEQAAKCYLALEKPEEAMKILARRNDIIGFKSASQIAFICKKNDVGEEYARKMSQLCLQNYDWNSMNELIEKQTQLRDMMLLGVVHRKLCHQLKALNLLDATLQEHAEGMTVLNGDKPGLPEIFLNADIKGSMILWEPVQINRQSFLHNVLKTWYHDCDLKMEEAMIRDLYDGMLAAKPTVAEHMHLSYRQGIVHVSGDIALLVLALLLGNKTAALRHMLDAMVTCYDQKLDKLLQGICNIVLPLGPEYISRFSQEVQAVKVAARYDGTISSSAGNTIAEIGKQEIQQEAITGYYCWSVVNYVLQNLEMTDACGKNVEDGEASLEKIAKEVDDAEGNRTDGGGDVSKTQKDADAEVKQDDAAAVDGCGDCISQDAKDRLGILDYITGVRIESLYQVLLHKVQSRRTMCTEKLKFIESAIKLVRERTKEEDNIYVKDDLGQISLPAIGPRTPIPSVCIDDGDADQVEKREPSPEYVELKIVSLEPEADSSREEMQVRYKKTESSTPELDVTGAGLGSCLNAAVPSMNTSLDANSSMLGAEGLNQLSPFGSPGRSDDPNLSADLSGDYVEMDKVRAWAAARKRQSDFALMMFKDSCNYENVPDEWYQMPASEKYTVDYITMDILVSEKAQVSKQLEEVAFFVKDVPFPNPYLSAKVLFDICQSLHGVYQKDVCSHIETITAWIKEHGVTKEQLDWIESK